MSEPSSGLLSRLGLLDADGCLAAVELAQRIERDGLETIRFLFADQHGVLRGKTLTAAAAPSALLGGVTAPSSLLLKDTSGATVFPVWSEDAGFGPGQMTGAGDMLLMPRPLTYRRLPWSPHSAWVLCDPYLPDGTAIPVASRHVLTRATDALAARDLDLIVGLEIEFHAFPFEDRVPSDRGNQLLSETRFAMAEPLLDTLRRAAEGLDLPVRSVEVEMGPNQYEFTFEPASATEHADNFVLFRTMIKEVCARNGFHATFMCRPLEPGTAASGWHIHQSLVERSSGRALFADGLNDGPARHWIAGLLAHASEATILTTPTVNGYRRYQPGRLAPDRIQWGHDNKGAMLRALFSPGEASNRVENRAPEPAANPYFALAAQALCGLSGIETELEPPPPSETPYSAQAKALPTSLGEALEAFRNGNFFAEKLGSGVSDYISHIKQAEWQRYLANLSEWERTEYSDLL